MHVSTKSAEGMVADTLSMLLRPSMFPNNRGDIPLLARHFVASAKVHAAVCVGIAVLWPTVLRRCIVTIAAKQQQRLVLAASKMLKAGPPFEGKWLEDIVGGQRSAPVPFGQNVADHVYRALRWFQRHVVRLYIRSVVVGTIVFLTCRVVDGLPFLRRVSDMPEGWSTFAFFTFCVTCPSRLELRYPWVMTLPCFVLRAVPHAWYTPFSQVGVRGLSESQVTLLVSGWSWRCYAAWCFATWLPDCISMSIDDGMAVVWSAEGDERSKLIRRTLKRFATGVLAVAVTAVLVKCGSRVDRLNNAPLIGGRGSAYAASCLALLFR